jgi:hypothetical protein
MMDISNWTWQHVFDFVVQKINEQNALSFVQDELGAACCYRGPHGVRCAAGWLIDDEDYKLSYEGKCVSDPPLDAVFPEHHRDLIGRLQDAHDDAAITRKGVAGFNLNAERLARELNLEWKPCCTTTKNKQSLFS